MATMEDLMNRIDQLEQKLVKPEPESLSSKMMRQARAARDRNTVTLPTDLIMGNQGETQNVTEHLRREVEAKRQTRAINDQLRKAGSEGRING